MLKKICMKFYVLAVSNIKAPESIFDLAVKKGEGQLKVIILTILDIY